MMMRREEKRREGEGEEKRKWGEMWRRGKREGCDGVREERIRRYERKSRGEGEKRKKSNALPRNCG